MAAYKNDVTGQRNTGRQATLAGHLGDGQLGKRCVEGRPCRV